METNYQNLQYTDDEKAAAYVKAIIKAVEKAVAGEPENRHNIEALHRTYQILVYV